MIIILVGRTASGKTTLAKEFEDRGFKRIITYTTRIKRPGEIDGIDYHFVDEDRFFLMKDMGYLAEVTQYEMENGTVYYGSAWSDYVDNILLENGTPYTYTQDDNRVVVLNPKGIQYMRMQTDIFSLANVHVVWIDPGDDILKIRLAERKDSKENIRLRFEVEKPDFSMLEREHLYDLKVTDLLPPNELADYILKEIQNEKD